MDTTEQLGVGRVLSQGWALFWQAWLPISGVLLVTSLVATGLTGVLFGYSPMIPNWRNSLGAPLELPETFPLVVGVVAIVLIYSQGWGSAYVMAHEVSHGRPAGIGAAVKRGFKLTPVIFLNYVIFLVYLVLSLLIPILLLVTMNAFIGSSMLGLVMFILLLVSALWAFAAGSCLFVSVIVEGLVVSAILRSFRLTKGYRWPIVGLFTLMAVIMVLAMLVSAALVFLPVLLWDGEGAVVLAIAGQVLQFVASVLMYGIAVCINVALYRRLVEIKDGGSRELEQIFA